MAGDALVLQIGRPIATIVTNWSGFHKLPFAKRLEKVAAATGVEVEQLRAYGQPLGADLADAFIENAAGQIGLPVGFAVGFVIDGQDVVVPMAVEESSVIAAASNGAKLAAFGGGITTAAGDPVTVAQVEMRGDFGEPDQQIIADASSELMQQLDEVIPSMVKRGGGLRAISTRLLPGRLVVHLHVDCRDAMGANVVNTIAEAAAPKIQRLIGGEIGLRILTNLADERLVRASCRIPVAKLGGIEVANAMVAANDFAIVDPYRAATHNKGILNGIDPVVLATGNDWRAVEAGAHAYAARSGQYSALTSYVVEGDELVAEIAVPIAVGVVGGVTKLNPAARTSLAVLQNPSATQLARICGAVGLAQNLAALRALSVEGIQAGHMRLHQKNANLRQKSSS